MKKITEQIPNGYVRVTSVLEPFTDFGNIKPEVLANAADRGSRVHDYCEAHALGLFVGEVDEDCKNYFEVFKKWFDDNVTEVVMTEKRINSEKYRLSGKFDLLARLRGSDDLVIVDYKTPASKSKTWPLQTAAYYILLGDAGIAWGIQSHVRRICLMLPKYGDSVTVVEHTDLTGDCDKFLKALELYRYFNG